MGVADRRVSEADDPPDHGRARVWREPEHERPDEVLSIVHLVKRVEAVEPFEQVVDEIGHPHQVLGSAAREDDVLRPQGHELVVVFQRLAVDVPFIAQRPELFD